MKVSAGILLFRRGDPFVEVLLIHPGGPFFQNKDLWSIPKGLVEPGEDLQVAALREFEEEVGIAPPSGPRLELGQIKQKAGKIVHAWGIEGAFDPKLLKSNVFEMEWPPNSGRVMEFAEADRAEWFTPRQAKRKMIPAQYPLVERLLTHLNEEEGS